MIAKTEQKRLAIKLRKAGLSYWEILQKVPVAKSTLSLWLSSVGLSTRQKQRLTKKRLAAIFRGAAKKREMRIKKSEAIIAEAANDIKLISKRELWLLGVALYWAEGNKEKEYNIGQRVAFSNSDPMMIKLFLQWLKKILKIGVSEITLELYIHENSKPRLREVIEYWSKALGIASDAFTVYFKKSKPRILRRNIGDSYFGLVRINVKKSTDLNRRISGWIKGICKCCRVV